MTITFDTVNSNSIKVTCLDNFREDLSTDLYFARFVLFQNFPTVFDNNVIMLPFRTTGFPNLVPRVARTSPSKDSTARSGSRYFQIGSQFGSTSYGVSAHADNVSVGIAVFLTG